MTIYYACIHNEYIPGGPQRSGSCMGRLLQLRGESISLLNVNGGPLSLYGRLVTCVCVCVCVGGGTREKGGRQRKRKREMKLHVIRLNAACCSFCRYALISTIVLPAGMSADHNVLMVAGVVH